MNFSGISAIISASFLLLVAVAASESKDALMKAIITSLPEACRKLHRRGMFNALASEDYVCMFESEESEEYKKAARVLVLLTQSGQKKIVNEVAKIWIKKSHWGPFNQSDISNQLSWITSAGSKKSDDSSNLIESKAVYETFLSLFETGKELLVPGPTHASLLAKAINLASRVDENESARNATVENVVIPLLPISSASASASADQVKMFADVFTSTQILNALVQTEEIHQAPWTTYAPLICKELNKQFCTDFALVDVSDESLLKKFPSATKLIQLSAKFVTAKTELILKDYKLGNNKSSKPSKSYFTFFKLGTFETGSAGFWMAIAGFTLLVIISGVGIYFAYSKMKSSDEESL